MQRSPARRRSQFSSCDTCRLSRVACDASKCGHQPGQTGWTGSCSRCLWRSQRCTFEWIKKSPSRLRTGPKSRAAPVVTELPISYELADNSVCVGEHELSTRTTETFNSNNAQTSCAPSSEPIIFGSELGLIDARCSSAQSIDNQLTRWGEYMFHHGFGAIFGHWVGRNGCPFVNDPTSDITVAPMELFKELDSCMDKQLDGSLGYTFVTSAQRQERNFATEQSLHRAVDSFAARWLPAVMQRALGRLPEYEEAIKERWRTTRKDMLRVINRTSYRSVLTLYLFSQTPIPVGIPEEEELDGISRLVCGQTALLHLQQLRERLRSCRFDDSMGSARSDAVIGSAAGPNLTQAFLDLESRAYWAAITWDTSSSVTLNIRSSLTSGLKGACLEPAWRLARGFLVGSFHARTEGWRNNAFEVSDGTTLQVISAAGVCMLYTWKTIASLKEALREGVEESDILLSWNAFLDALNVYKTTIYPLLRTCERRLHFLGQTTRLNWYEVGLHYHLGILILADVVEAANRLDLLSQLTETRLDAEQESFTVLNFGLESKYTIPEPPGELSKASDDNSTTHFNGQPITLSFVAMDPYPHQVVTLVQLLQKAISRQYQQGKIKLEVYSSLSTTLLRALEQLPQNYKTVQSA